MKKAWLLSLCCLLWLPAVAQQVVYASLKELVENRGDTVADLRIEKRTRNQIYLLGGADYRITVNDNPSLCSFLKRRCYAVLSDTSLYVNCRRMRYKRFRFGQWYAPALWVQGKIYYSAQPVGQVAAATAAAAAPTKLGGEVGDAIAASGLVHLRVCYELDPSTGRSSFVGRDEMLQLLSPFPRLQAAFEQESGDDAALMMRYLRLLRDAASR